MNIVVCVKIIQGDINPFDASALEAVLQRDDVRITVLSMGPLSSLESLSALTRLGNFKTILISDPNFAGSDTLATSYILSCAIRKLQPDLVLCGRQSIDGETAQVGIGLAIRLNYSFIANVLNFSLHQCETRQGTEQIQLPALLTMERSYTLRFPSLYSKTRSVEVWDSHFIGVNLSRCGFNGSPTRVLETFESKRGKRTCCFIQRHELEPLLNILRTKNRSDNKKTQQKEQYLQQQDTSENQNQDCRIWTIGTEVREQAFKLSTEVLSLEKRSAEEIATESQRKKPDVILWNADTWGRKTASQVATILETGLCADCIDLATDGNALIMYRPAYAGNKIAKIICRTRPQMATVRTPKISTNMIIGCGKGVADDFERVKKFASDYSAEIVASRGLVDTGIVPYKMQAGLTGKNISPKIYLALGISGAIQHLCAVENSETIIAVNKDKNARIFEYADYGIVSEF
ncbi:MAG: FAD-binding protein [Planctomycetaceae bacterium]|jgi:electron transfer flavoprotein alpha subunit|nr:FAD-binding protein [Planctomycetaceae bacterium]